MRRTTSLGPFVFFALAALTTGSAGASDDVRLAGRLVRCSQDAPPPVVSRDPAAPDDPATSVPESSPSVPETAPGSRSDDDAAPFARVGPLLQSRCAMPGCHLGPEAARGLRLEIGEIYPSAVNVRSRTDPKMKLVVPGSAEQSLLYLKLLPPEAGHYRGPRMPRAMDPLSDEEIALVRAWIEAFPLERWGSAPIPAPAALPESAPRTFHDSALINLPGPDPLGRNTLEFRILHRFQSSVRESGSHDLYGLDSGAWISIGLAYGLMDSLEVGVRRTNLQHDYEAYGKWVAIRQDPGRSPLSVALRGSFSNMREKNASNANRYGAQAIIARRFGEHLSLMLVPTHVTRTNFVDASDTRGTTAVGAGAEVRLGSRAAITGEWITQVGGVKNDFQAASIGYSIATARHAFLVFVTNTAGAHTDLYAPGGDLDAREGYVRLGFNISRTFTPDQRPRSPGAASFHRPDDFTRPEFRP